MYIRPEYVSEYISDNNFFLLYRKVLVCVCYMAKYNFPALQAPVSKVKKKNFVLWRLR